MSSYTNRKPFMSKSAFSELAGLDGLAHGVTTVVDQCDHKLPYTSRRDIDSALLSAQDLIEAEVGYAVTPRYRTQELRFTGLETVYQLDFGLRAVNVRERYTVLQSVDVHHYLNQSMLSTETDGMCVLTLDGSFYADPMDAVIRGATNGSIYKPQSVNGYPYLDVSGNWKIVLDKPHVPPCSIELNVSHARYAWIDTTGLGITDFSNIILIDPKSDRIIPYFIDANIPNKILVYFWDILSSGFEQRGSDMSKNEYYKFLTSLNLVQIEDEEYLPIVRFVDGETLLLANDDEYATVEILDASRGLVRVTISASLCTPVSRKIKSIIISYATDPSLIHQLELNRYEYNINLGIASKVAAEIKPGDCDGCKIQNPFIRQAQQPYSEVRINPITGENILNLTYGNLYGQLVFGEQLTSLPKRRRTITL